VTRLCIFCAYSQRILSLCFISPTHPSLYPSRRSEVPRGAWTTLAASSAGDPEIRPYPPRGRANYRRNSLPVKRLLSDISSPLRPTIPRDPSLAGRGRPERLDPGNSPRICSNGRNQAELDEAPLDCPGRRHRRTDCSLSYADPTNRNVFNTDELIEDDCFDTSRLSLK